MEVVGRVVWADKNSKPENVRWLPGDGKWRYSFECEHWMSR